MLGHFHVAPAPLGVIGRVEQEEVGDPVALVFVVVAGRLSGLGRLRRAHFLHQLLVLVEGQCLRAI